MCSLVEHKDKEMKFNTQLTGVPEREKRSKESGDSKYQRNKRRLFQEGREYEFLE